MEKQANWGSEYVEQEKGMAPLILMHDIMTMTQQKKVNGYNRDVTANWWYV